MTARARWALAALALPLLAVAACGDDDDASTPSPTASPSATASATATEAATSPAATATDTPSASATATTSPALALAQSPQYVIYEASDGDTVQQVADAFDASSDAPPAEFVTAIRSLNQLARDDLVAGQLLGVPVMLPGDLSLFADASLEAALGSKAGGPALLQPSLEMREGFLGKLVLHRVKLDLPAAPGEPAGYVMEYWLADRPPVKGGVVDPDAHVADRQFVVAGGTLAGELTGSPADLHTWQANGTDFALRSYIVSPALAALAAMLEEASSR